MRFPDDAERLRQCREGVDFDLGQARQFIETCLPYDADYGSLMLASYIFG